MQYVVVYEQTPTSWGAYVPDVPGCVAVGATREETQQLIREALAFHLEGLCEDGEPIPRPGTWTESVDVPTPHHAAPDSSARTTSGGSAG